MYKQQLKRHIPSWRIKGFILPGEGEGWVGKFQWVFWERWHFVCLLILPKRFDVSKCSGKGKFLTSRPILIAHVNYSA